MSGAVTTALGQWNALSSSSGVKFDPVPPGQQPDIQIQSTSDSSGNTGGCAAYSANSGRVYYGETFLQALSNPGVGATILAHEFGHALGLKDGGASPNPPSIMNNPTNSLPYACTNPNVPTTAPQPTDASGSKSCTAIARQQLNKLYQRSGITTSIDSTPIQGTYGSCVVTYYTEYYYVDGQFDSAAEYLADEICS